MRGALSQLRGEGGWDEGGLNIGGILPLFKPSYSYFLLRMFSSLKLGCTADLKGLAFLNSSAHENAAEG
jgi:hypothetical protein